MATRPSKPEILAPAGSAEALAAALASGADAVYFGLQDGWNARARAANFALDALPATVARIHRAGARAYLTLNTLLFEPELEHVERVLRAVAAAGVDALIVQDPAVCLLARALCPELELHASTQMTISSPAAAEFAAGLGVTRVVVPRELSAAEIRAFAQRTPLELEVFVHGALCVSWSGQCLTSEAWGGRSANRGQCAQSCRMPYSLLVDGERRELGDVQYLLSPRDLAGAAAVPALLETGVHGLKIEGRQKGPQYVATAVAGYRRWVDALTDGGDPAAAQRQLAQDLLAMALSYSRGFSQGFLAGADHQALVEGRFPKHRGVYLGRVEAVRASEVVVQPAEQAALDVQPGMGVVFDQGRPEDEHEPGGPIFRVSRQADTLLLGFGAPGPALERVRPGDRVWATSDPRLAVRPDSAEPAGRVVVHLTVEGRCGEPLVVQARAGIHAAVVRSDTALAAARGPGLDAALLRAKLGAFGGTPFRLGTLTLDGLEPRLHLPPAELKELRRRLVAALLPRVERGAERMVAAEPVLPRVRAALALPVPAGARPPRLVPLCRSDAQLDAALALGLPEIELDWMELQGLGRAVDRVRAAGRRVVVATLRIGKPGEEPIDERLWKLAPDGILVRHLGALVRLLELRAGAARPVLHGDFSLNVANALTARWLLRQGLDTVTASYDLDQEQMLALLEQVPAARVAVIAHHRIPTFHTEHCVYAHQLSQGRDYRTCGRPCERHRVALRDHLGREHPVIVDAGCRNTVFHHAPQSTAGLAPRLLELGVRRFRVELVREDARQAERVLRAWQALLAGEVDAEQVLRRTGAEARVGVGMGRMALLGE